VAKGRAMGEVANTAEILANSVLHATCAAGIGTALDIWVEPAVTNATGAYTNKSPLQETVEVLAQFLLSLWAARDVMDFVLPADYRLPVSDTIFYALLFEFQPNLRFKAHRLIRSGLMLTQPRSRAQCKGTIKMLISSLSAKFHTLISLYY
jgi:hypothetical protein